MSKPKTIIKGYAVFCTRGILKGSKILNWYDDCAISKTRKTANTLKECGLCEVHQVSISIIKPKRKKEFDRLLDKIVDRRFPKKK